MYRFTEVEHCEAMRAERGGVWWLILYRVRLHLRQRLYRKRNEGCIDEERKVGGVKGE